ncbi:NADP-dependent oxidoreductase domain-containing protein, partial [Dunaliella salina]
MSAFTEGFYTETKGRIVSVEAATLLWGGGGQSQENEGREKVRVLDYRWMEKLGLTAAEVHRLQEEMAKEIQERKLIFAKRYSILDPQPTAHLSNGYIIPLVGLGTWHIDCASVYANEHEVKKEKKHCLTAARCSSCIAYFQDVPVLWMLLKVGAALQEVFNEGIVSREELFITSKLWNSDHAPARVEPAVRKTLSDLQLDYLDAYLIHFPSSMPGPVIRPSLLDVWRAMEALVDKGLVRSIGVSNFSVKKLQSILSEARIPMQIVQ